MFFSMMRNMTHGKIILHLPKVYNWAMKKTTTWLFSFFFGGWGLKFNATQLYFGMISTTTFPSRIPNFSQSGVIHGIRSPTVFFFGFLKSPTKNRLFFPLRWSVDVGCNKKNHSNWRIQLICFLFSLAKPLGSSSSVTSSLEVLNVLLQGIMISCAEARNCFSGGFWKAENRTKSPWEVTKSLVICRKIMDYTRCK